MIKFRGKGGHGGVFLDMNPFNSFPKAIQAMQGLTPGVQYATLATFVAIVGIIAFTVCYTHPRK